MPDRVLELLAPVYAAAAPADRAVLLAGVRPALATRIRFAERDAAVREAFATAHPLELTAASIMIATEYQRYVDSAWQIEQRGRQIFKGSPLRQALRALARTNGGVGISARQLRRIYRGTHR